MIKLNGNDLKILRCELHDCIKYLIVFYRNDYKVIGRNIRYNMFDNMWAWFNWYDYMIKLSDGDINEYVRTTLWLGSYKIDNHIKMNHYSFKLYHGIIDRFGISTFRPIKNNIWDRIRLLWFC